MMNAHFPIRFTKPEDCSPRILLYPGPAFRGNNNREVVRSIGADDLPRNWGYGDNVFWLFKTEDNARAIADTFPWALDESNPDVADFARWAKTFIRQAPRPQDSVPIPAGNIPGLRTQAWDHQRQAWAFAHGKPGAMLAMGMGTGKSLTTVALLHDANLSLIICPKAVQAVWPREFERHSDYQPEVQVLQGSVAQRTKQLQKLVHKQQVTHCKMVIIVNYDAVWREPLADEILKVRWDAVVMDECHKIKSPSGKASRFCARLRRSAARMYGLTGTPMPHSPLDIYAQYRAIQPEIFGSNKTVFDKRYAVKGGFGGYEVIGYRNQDEMRSKFLSIAYQAGREVISLPDATHTEIPVTLSPKARKVYTELKMNFIAFLEGGNVTTANALVKLLRLQQVTGGTLKNDDGAMVEVSRDKRDALQELLEGMGGEPCVVFCRFTSDIDAVADACRELGLGMMELSGRRNQLADWQKAGSDYPVIAVQIQAGGVGVDLTRASYCVYYSLGFSLGDYEQSLARVHRPGQKRPVSYYHLIAEGTVDEQVYSALQARKDVVESILQTSK